MSVSIPAPPYDPYHVTLVKDELRLQPEDTIVAVMGMTGAGKSTFIKHVTGEDDIVIGHSLKACTQDLRVLRLPHPDGSGRRLVLVDTQGFDDDQIEDADVLDKIAGWMAGTYSKGVKLSGLLFFHKITDNRMGGTSLKNLKMFKELVGEESLSNVVLVTTMWGLVDEATGAERERDLTQNSNYWAGMIARGAQCARFQDTPESGREIIGLLRGRPPIVTQVQRQMIDDDLPVGKTSAGIAVDKGLEKMRLQHEQMIADLLVEHRKAMEAGNQTMQKQIEKERVEFEQRLKLIEEKRQRLMAKPWWRRFAEGFLQVATLGIVNTSGWE